MISTLLLLFIQTVLHTLSYKQNYIRNYLLHNLCMYHTTLWLMASMPFDILNI